MEHLSIGVHDLDERSRRIFREIVDTYLDTGEPVGSRTISQSGVGLSAASIRNVMSDLEKLGLLHSPHTSAGRIPTHSGLRLFVDGLLELGDLSRQEQAVIEQRLTGSNEQLDDVLTQASAMLSGLSHCASLVVTSKSDAPIKHIEFVALNPGQALVILVNADGNVENRLIEIPLGLPASALTQAGNFLNARLQGRSLSELRQVLLDEIDGARKELDALTLRLVEIGIATWSGADDGANGSKDSSLIIRGRSNLIDELGAAEDVERVRLLFDDLENKRELIQLMELASSGQGVKIFIGSETKLFSLSGSSLIVSPYVDKSEKIVGALGVIGPTRLNYARIIPLVDYTAKVVGRLLSG